MLTEDEYNATLDEIVGLFTVSFEFNRMAYAQFIKGVQFQSPNPSRTRILGAVISAHMQAFYTSAPFPDAIFDDIIAFNKQLVADRPLDGVAELVKSYTDEYDNIVQGKPPIDPHSIGYTTAFSAFKLGEALERYAFAFAFREALLPAYTNVKTAVYVENDAECNLNQTLLGFFLPADLVGEVVAAQHAFALRRIQLLLRGTPKILEYPPNATEEEKKKIRELFEKEQLRSNYTR